MVDGILAIVSHPDDETFGCGGTLAKHVHAGVDTHVLCLTCNPINRKREFISATKVLGVDELLWVNENLVFRVDMIRKIADLIDEFRPRVIITHVPFDYHWEHKICYNLVKEAIEWAAHTTMYQDAWQVERLLLMEVNTLIPRPLVFVDLTENFNTKMKAILQYTTQMEKFPWNYYQKFNMKKAELRGVQCNVNYAEAFIEESLPLNGPFYKHKSSNLLV
jgi:LmbE family N-acetylglucosaminyl deacetylase